MECNGMREERHYRPPRISRCSMRATCSNSRESAVLKGWVESRFGLTPRYHHGPIRHYSDATHRQRIGCGRVAKRKTIRCAREIGCADEGGASVELIGCGECCLCFRPIPRFSTS